MKHVIIVEQKMYNLYHCFSLCMTHENATKEQQLH